MIRNIAGIFLLLLLFSLALLTPYYGSTDLGDYADVAKYFAGLLKAKIRNSHSYLFGFLHAPFVRIMQNFLIFKITNLLLLCLLIFSVSKITSQPKALWLMMLAPAVWYSAPWITPLPIASLCLLWAFVFMEKYDATQRITYLLSSGIFVGLGLAFWNTLLYLALFLMIVYLYNKSVLHFVGFILALGIGLLPLLLLDFLLFNFPFYTLIKTTMGNLVATFLGGIYGGESYPLDVRFLISRVLFLSALPIYFWTLYLPQRFRENRKRMIFLTLSLLLFLVVLQLRYLIILTPLMVVAITRYLTPIQFKRQVIISFLVSLLFVIPYVLQISALRGDLYGTDIGSFSLPLPESPAEMITEDLHDISEEYPDATLVVGNKPDDYQLLAHLYWGSRIKEFVSVQDYELALRNQSVLFEKRFMPAPNIAERRQIWIIGGIGKNLDDPTDYQRITLGIGVGEPLQLNGFTLVKRYRYLYLSKRD